MNYIPIHFPEAAKLLSAIYPDQNWGEFLSLNMLGLTPEFETIPYERDGNEIIYAEDDLKDFAIIYGWGTTSLEDIEDAMGAFFDNEVHELLAELEASLIADEAERRSLKGLADQAKSLGNNLWSAITHGLRG